jgi:hypothetical protein
MEFLDFWTLHLEHAVCAVCTTSPARRHAPESRVRELGLTAMVSCCTVSILIYGTVTQSLAADEIVALCRRTHRLSVAQRSHHHTESVEALPSDERL